MTSANAIEMYLGEEHKPSKQKRTKQASKGTKLG